MNFILKRIAIGSVFAIASAHLHASTTPTDTSLIVSPANPVSAGTIVTLTANVLASRRPVTLGTVKFCNAAVMGCELGGGLYGSTQLTSTGTATLIMSFGAGINTVKAVFVSTNVNTTSTSSTATINVSPLPIFPSLTSLTSSGNPGNYTLDGSVSAPGRQPLTGTIGFTDLSNGNLQLLTTSLGPSARSFGTIAKYPIGGVPPNLSFVAVGDFNGDGKQDLAVTNQLSNTVSILMGNGDGSFRPEVSLSTGTHPVSISVGDLNGDGRQDFVVANQSGTVSVFLGNGDGTFQPSVTFQGGPQPVYVALGDFNGDGRQDVVVTNGNLSNTVSVLLGNGDGTFQQEVSYRCGANPVNITVGDFNGDGYQDLVVPNDIIAGPGSISVLLGNGDGTFRSPLSYAVGDNPSFVVVGDFDGDGNQDLAVTSGVVNGEVSVLMGDGHATFQLLGNYPTGKSPSSLSVGDFNGDGVEDLVVASSGSSSPVSIYLGIGDGEFQPSVAPAIAGAQIIAVGDFNGDGMDDLVATNSGASVVSTLLGVQQASYSVSGISVIGQGTHAVFASYSGDSSRIASQSNTVTLTATPGIASVTMVSAPNPSIVGAVVTLSALLTGANGIEPTGIVTFKDGATIIGERTILGSSASITTANLSVGTHQITAVYGGDHNYYGSSSLPLAQVINNKIEASISLTSSADPSTYGGNITFTATVSSGATGTVTFVDGTSILGSANLNVSGQAVISVASLAIGTHNITATYSGDSSHF
jgi:hypothetical protein